MYVVFRPWSREGQHGLINRLPIFLCIVEGSSFGMSELLTRILPSEDNNERQMSVPTSQVNSTAPSFLKPFSAKPSKFNGTRGDQEVLFCLSQSIHTSNKRLAQLLQCRNVKRSLPRLPVSKRSRAEPKTTVRREAELVVFKGFNGRLNRLILARLRCS